VAQPSSTAVAVGIASAEYNNYIVQRASSGVSAYSATGGALSVASGRLRCGGSGWVYRGWLWGRRAGRRVVVVGAQSGQEGLQLGATLFGLPALFKTQLMAAVVKVICPAHSHPHTSPLSLPIYPSRPAATPSHSRALQSVWILPAPPP